MLKIKRLAIVALPCLILFAWTAWLFLPRPVAAALIHLNNQSAGLTAKSVATNIGEVHYLEGGQGPTIVLIHGIYARKEHWVEMARKLVTDYHVIALDLPGFGDNTPLPDAAYHLDQQRGHLGDVFDALQLENVHIAANSMGAYVAALMIADAPDIAATFALIGSPLGVPTPVESDMDQALARGDIPLLAQSETAFFARNDFLSPKIPYVPGPILNTWMHDEVAMADKNARIWDIVHNQSDVPTVLELAPKLKLPTFILWCTPDRIFHVSGARILDQSLPTSQLTIPENCGHVPMLDQPQQTADLYRMFLRSVE
jgi:pimeloyl-ACP methyl ester carboxylesterase